MLILICMVIPLCVSGQNVEGLYSRYGDATGSRRVALANEIAQAVYDMECIDSLYRIENHAERELVDAIVNRLMASYSEYALNNLPKAVTFALNAAQLYEQMGDMDAMNSCHSDASVYYYRMANYEKAIDLMLKCYEFEREMSDMHALSATINNLGIAYSNWGKSEVAIDYFYRAIDIERPLNRPLQYAGRLSALAKELSLLGNYPKAIELIKEALDFDLKLEGTLREERLATHNIIMGDIYVEADSLLQAQTCYEYAVAVFEKINRQQLFSASLLSLGRLQLKQHRYPDAIATLQQCISISEENQLRRTLMDANRFMYEAHKEIGNVTQALHHLEQQVILDASLYKESVRTQLNEFQVRYETAEKELEIVRQQTEIDKYTTRQTLFLTGLFIAGVLLVMLVYVVTLRTRRNRELSEMNATKDKFFSIISHDLKNPAVSQRDALQLLLDNAHQWDSAFITHYSGKLLKSAKEQVDLLYSLLDWAQIETGRMPFHPTPFDLVAALQPDISIINDMAATKGIIFEIRTPDTAPVTGDYNMITAIVRNLLTNAVKFTAKGETVMLHITPSGAVHPTPAYTVSVADSGIGMNSEELQSLFRIDRQRSRKGTSGEQGNGLGLIVCKELIQKHGTELHVESEEGKGSLFRFELK